MTSGRSCSTQPRRRLWRCERWIDSNPPPSHDSLNTKIPTIILHIYLDFAARSHSQARFLRLCLLFQNATDDDSSLLHPRSQLFCIVFDNMAFYTAYNSMPLALVHTPEHALSRSTSPHLGLVIPTSQRGVSLGTTKDDEHACELAASKDRRKECWVFLHFSTFYRNGGDGAHVPGHDAIYFDQLRCMAASAGRLELPCPAPHSHSYIRQGLACSTACF